MSQLPALDNQKLNPTRDYLRDVALAMGSLQRGFLEPQPHDWQHGLEVTLRGVSTQTFMAGGQPIRVLLDLVKDKVRMDGSFWKLESYSGAELFNNFKSWLETHNLSVKLEEPVFRTGRYDHGQSQNYAAALWWMHRQLQIIKADISYGETSPILLYPHHFDLAMSWFPHDDERQITIGFSTSDESVAEPYIYATVYPEPDGLAELMADRLPAEAYWQKRGFSGGVLPYAKLQQSDQPAELLKQFVGQLMAYAAANY